MKNVEKYKRSYFKPPVDCFDWVKKDYIDKAPIWCSVDLRDGNQALIEPMNLFAKIEYFKLLVNIGFKEIEVGFPAASDTEFLFIRKLIEEGLIPDDVTIQVLTQAREHIIKRTFEAVSGAKRAVIHVYNSTSVAQREQVFKKDKEEVKQIAINGAKLLKKYAQETPGNFVFQYSPESFSGTEVEYALEVCNDVLKVWKPSPDKKAIINLPTTVQVSMPHVFAYQVEYFHKYMNHRENVILSLHPHNDRGCGVSDAELGLLAGADRVEGTLFGNGERTGNVDLITLALNLYSHGVNPGLDLSKLPEIAENYEDLTDQKIGTRQPYAGELVFTAFSGSHQDAIAKGMSYREEFQKEIWDVPYLPLDPADIGRAYESDVIRINSQSGKGGISYILKHHFGMKLPEKMKEEVGYLVKGVSDKEEKELDADWIYQIFEENYIRARCQFKIEDCRYVRNGKLIANIILDINGEKVKISGEGNGRLDSASNAIKGYFNLAYELTNYEEHALTTGSCSNAVAYVSVDYEEKTYWGVGVDPDIVQASLEALVVAVNKVLCLCEEECKD